MAEEHGVAIIIPAFNEEKYIQQTISSIQDHIELVILVNDGSTDSTIKVAKKEFKSIKRENIDSSTSKSLYKIINQKKTGVGAAVINGLNQILNLEKSSILKEKYPNKKQWIIVVMDADGQMDSNDLPEIIKPLINNSADHVKGIRIGHKGMPPYRKFGSFLLKKLMRLASGYPKINDPQCGYRAITLEMLKTWDFKSTWKGFGYPNWWLLEAGRRSYKLKEIPVKSIYNDKKSKLKIIYFLPTVSILIFRKLWLRGWDWYVLGKGSDSKLKRLFICSTWFGSIISLLNAILFPKNWLIYLSIFIIGLISTRIIDVKESERRLNLDKSPIIN